MIIFDPICTQETTSKPIYKCFICTSCKKYVDNQDSKVLCLANGRDFGDYKRIGLSPLNELERIILSTMRLYRIIIKLQHSKTSADSRHAIKGHYVAFRHDAPFKAGNIFNEAINVGNSDALNELLKTIKLCLVADKNEVDKLMSHCMNLPDGVICARGWVILQWLLVLKEVNPRHYGEIIIPTKENMDKFLQKLKSELKKDVLKITDENAVEYDKRVGDDAARVRTENVLDEGNEVIKQIGKLLKFLFLFLCIFLCMYKPS